MHEVAKYQIAERRRRLAFVIAFCAVLIGVIVAGWTMVGATTATAQSAQGPCGAEPCRTGEIPGQGPCGAEPCRTGDIPGQGPCGAEPCRTGEIPGQGPCGAQACPTGEIPGQGPCGAEACPTGEIPDQGPCGAQPCAPPVAGGDAANGGAAGSGAAGGDAANGGAAGSGATGGDQPTGAQAPETNAVGNEAAAAPGAPGAPGSSTTAGATVEGQAAGALAKNDAGSGTTIWLFLMVTAALAVVVLFSVRRRSRREPDNLL